MQTYANVVHTIGECLSPQKKMKAPPVTPKRISPTTGTTAPPPAPKKMKAPPMTPKRISPTTGTTPPPAPKKMKAPPMTPKRISPTTGTTAPPPAPKKMKAPPAPKQEEIVSDASFPLEEVEYCSFPAQLQHGTRHDIIDIRVNALMQEQEANGGTPVRWKKAVHCLKTHQQNVRDFLPDLYFIPAQAATFLKAVLIMCKRDSDQADTDSASYLPPYVTSEGFASPPGSPLYSDWEYACKTKRTCRLCDLDRSRNDMYYLQLARNPFVIDGPHHYHLRQFYICTRSEKNPFVRSSLSCAINASNRLRWKSRVPS
jgi:hypothetical protein